MARPFHVLSFVGFKLYTSAEFDTLAEADAYAHGMNHGYTLAVTGRDHLILYVAVLPRDEAEMRSMISPDEIERVFREVNL
jgi:hypothetical protein